MSGCRFWGRGPCLQGWPVLRTCKNSNWHCTSTRTTKPGSNYRKKKEDNITDLSNDNKNRWFFALSGPDGSRYSSEQYLKASEFRNFEFFVHGVQVLSGNLCPPEGKLPRCGMHAWCAFALFDFSSSRETHEPSGTEIPILGLCLSFVAASCRGLVWRHVHSRDTSGPLTTYATKRKKHDEEWQLQLWCCKSSIWQGNTQQLNKQTNKTLVYV